MTTIIADHRLGVMVCDSSISDDDRVWSGSKVYRHKGALLGFAGDVDEALEFLKWWKAGKPAKLPKFGHSSALILSDAGLVHYCYSLTPMPVKRGIEAIGSGGKAAICTYEALAWQDPVQAVKIVCRHDSGSRAPVRVYRLKP